MGLVCIRDKTPIQANVDNSSLVCPKCGREYSSNYLEDSPEGHTNDTPQSSSDVDGQSTSVPHMFGYSPNNPTG